MVTVIVDAENVRRSTWPNVPEREFVELVRAWATRNGVRALLVFDGRAPFDDADVVGTHGESADDWIAREAPSFSPYLLVTSDRELRRRAGGRAEDVVGGGSFVREIRR